MSGYLIFNSLCRNPSLYRFAAARALRSYQSFAVPYFGFQFFLLFYFGNYSNFVDHLRYIAQNVLMLLQVAPVSPLMAFLSSGLMKR